MTNAQDRPRPHHYEFAHRALPSVMLNPEVDLDRLAGDLDRLGAALRSTWKLAGEQLDHSDRLPDDGLDIDRVEAGDTGGLLISMPEALRVAEAHLVLVAPLDPAASRRLFTLEVGWDVVERRQYTVLGAWSNGTHLNLGAGPPATPGDFVDAVAAVLGRADG